MKLCTIILITFCCALSLSERSNVLQDENFVMQSPVENSSDKTKEIIELNTSDMLKRENKPKKKTKYVRNCLELKKKNKKSGAYLINPCDCCPTKVVKVYCDMDTDGGGWTVIQRRDNYTQQEDFFNTWYEYAIGFGDVSHDFWLGNDNIHCLAQQSHHEIRFDLKDFEDNSRYAKYGFFYVDDRINLYKLSVQDYSGDAGDSFGAHHNQNFSTFDFDNDAYVGNCASSYKGGWWYSACHASNLNGLYLRGNHSSYAKGVNWRLWKGYHYSLKKSEMKIREKN